MSKQPIPLSPLPKPRVEIINLIDVLITLIAFFMLTTVFAEPHRQLELELPIVSNTEKSATFPESAFLILELDQDGLLSYNGSLISSLDLPAILQQNEPNSPVLLRADRNCRYEAVVEIIDLLTDADFLQLALEVKENPF